MTTPEGSAWSTMSGFEHIFEHLLGQFFLAWLMLKQSSKRASQIFLNIYQIIPENIPTTIRIMQKLCFAVEFCICISNTVSPLKVSLNDLIAETAYFLLVSGYLAAHARSKCGWIRVLHKISFSYSTETCFST